MQTEETKGNEAKAKGTDIGCCNPENFQKMFEKMGKCLSYQCDTTDFPAVKGDTMKHMMEMCCSPKTAVTKEETALQKEQECDNGII